MIKKQPKNVWEKLITVGICNIENVQNKLNKILKLYISRINKYLKWGNIIVYTECRTTRIERQE